MMRQIHLDIQKVYSPKNFMEAVIKHLKVMALWYISMEVHFIQKIKMNV